MPYVDIRGERLFYAVHDQGAALDLVCIHSAGGDRTVWPLALSDVPDCNTYFLDLPGHGRSEGEALASVEAYADVVADFIATLGLQRVVLAGHSLGGAIVQDLALRQPPWLDALVLVSSGCRLRVPNELFQQLQDRFADAVEELTRTSFSPSAERGLVDQELKRRLAQSPEVLFRDLSACNDFDITDQLADIPHPTLILSGDIDHMTPLKYAQFLEDQIPDARLAVTAPAGHMLPIEQPDETTRLIREFVSTRRTG